MKITKIEKQKHRPTRRSLYIDGKFVIGVSEEIFFSYNIKEGQEIDSSLLDKIIASEKKYKIKEQALTLLTYRMRSKKELIDRLKKKGGEVSLINEVIKELERVDLINDTKFAELWVRERSKLYGPIRLRSELLGKGIDKEIIDKVLDKFDERTLSEHLAKQWLRKNKNLSPIVAKRRLFNFLARRGISYETIKSIGLLNYEPETEE
jgi:regulatory protein